MFAKVRSESYVTFVGVPGSGKTATARHIALKLQREGYEVLSIKNINDIEAYCDPNNPQVFVIDDVLGMYGLDIEIYNIMNKYEYTLKEPIMPITKVLMTCRELVYRNEMLSECFLFKQENVILLNSEENALSDSDKHKLLAKYRLGSDFLSSAEMKSSSHMFPFLCKFFSSKTDLKLYGSTFFISPVPCILDELQQMRKHTKIKYASLVLLMASENMLSRESLDNITKDNNEMYLNEKKSKFLEACKVSPDMASFEIIDALSEMEGTYTKKSDSEFTFIHDSVFEIVAFHFGLQFQELMLQYMSSGFIANYIKLETSNIQKNEIGGKQTSDKKEQNETAHIKMSGFDLRITLQESHHQTLAERLFRDVENGDLYNVFGNEALKHPLVLQAFIRIMIGKPYTKMHSLFLSELKETFNPCHYIHPKTDSDLRDHLKRMIHGMLINERFSKYYETSIRAISWVIYRGHHQLLQYITDRIIKEKNNLSDLFQNSYNTCDQFYPDKTQNPTFNESDIQEADWVSGEEDDSESIYKWCMLRLCCCAKSNTNMNNPSNFITPSIMEIVEDILSNIRESEENSYGQYDNMAACNADFEPDIDIYCEPVIVEQNRLLCLGCYSGDLNTVSILLKHVDGNAINITEMCHKRSYREMDSLSIACSLGYLEIVKKLISVGINVNQKAKFCSPLICACENGHNNVVEELIKAGADVNVLRINKTPLIAACRQGHLEIVTQLIKEGADVNLKHGNFTPLIAACFNGNVCIIEELIVEGADVNLNSEYNTPLLAACRNGHKFVAEILIKAGANINFNIGRVSPLGVACYNAHLDIVRTMIKEGALVNVVEQGVSLLTAVCLDGHLDIVRELITAGANVNLKHGKYTPLSAACFGGHFEIAKELLQAGANVNLNDKINTPLTAACLNGHLDLVEILIKAGAGVNQCKGNYTPLTVACFNGHFDVVKKLIKTGADVNLKHRKYSPLSAACRKGHLNIAEELILGGADVNQIQNNLTILSIECIYGHTDMVEKLIKAGAVVNLRYGNFTPLTAACNYGHINIVEVLLSAGADVNLDNGDRSPLGIALYKNHMNMARKLIIAGANVNQIERNFTLLITACLNGHLDVVEELITAGADVNLKHGNFTPLIAACRNGRKHLVAKLIKAGADVNVNKGDHSPIQIALYNANSDILQILIKAGADVIGRDIPLLTAECLNGHTDIAKDLIQAGADVNLKHGQYTPLTAACLNGHLDLVKTLITAGANVNLKQENYTPLTAACCSRHIDIAKELLQAGADVNINHCVYTPLTAACLNGQLDLVETLIKAGADVNLNVGNDTPLTLACFHGHLRIVKTLIKAGADVNLKHKKYSPLSAAIVCKHFDIAKTLTSSGASRCNETFTMISKDPRFTGLY